jgi:hypothetical protein
MTLLSVVTFKHMLNGIYCEVRGTILRRKCPCALLEVFHVTFDRSECLERCEFFSSVLRRSLIRGSIHPGTLYAATGAATRIEQCLYVLVFLR